MARNGKIARLPFGLRTVLNTKLRDGEPGTKLVEWLNSLPEVKRVLAAEFVSRRINEQNLTEWKQGGYEDWLRHEETQRWVSTLVEEAAELEQEAGDFSVADWLSAPLGVALGQCLQAVAAQPAGDPKQMQALFELNREISRLRRSDHIEERLRIERERRDAEVAAEEKKTVPARSAPSTASSRRALWRIFSRKILRSTADCCPRKQRRCCGSPGGCQRGARNPNRPMVDKPNQSESNQIKHRPDAGCHPWPVR